MRLNLKPYCEKMENDWRQLKDKMTPLLDEWDDVVGRDFQEKFWQEYEETVPKHIKALQQLEKLTNSAIKNLNV